MSLFLPFTEDLAEAIEIRESLAAQLHTPKAAETKRTSWQETALRRRLSGINSLIAHLDDERHGQALLDACSTHHPDVAKLTSGIVARRSPLLRDIWNCREQCFQSLDAKYRRKERLQNAPQEARYQLNRSIAELWKEFDHWDEQIDQRFRESGWRTLPDYLYRILGSERYREIEKIAGVQSRRL